MIFTQIFNNINDKSIVHLLFIQVILMIKMSGGGGCWDLRKRWDNLAGKSEKEAVEALKQDGRKDKKHKRKLNKYVSFYIT